MRRVSPTLCILPVLVGIFIVHVALKHKAENQRREYSCIDQRPDEDGAPGPVRMRRVSPTLC